MLWWCLIHCIFLIHSGFFIQPSETVAPIIQEDGIIVHDAGRTKAVAGIWTVVVLLEIPRVPDLSSIRHQIQQQILDSNRHLPGAAIEIWAMRRRFAELQLQTCADIIPPVTIKTDTRSNLPAAQAAHPDEQIHHRTKRGLFNFIGFLAKSLTGTALDSDVQELSHIVSGMQGEVSRLAQFDNYMVSVLNATQNVIRSQQSQIELLNEQTQQLHSIIVNINAKLNDHILAIQQLQIIQLIDQAITVLELASIAYKEVCQGYRRQVMQLERGRLSRDILPEGELEQILQGMRQKGMQTLSHHWYYAYMEIEPLWDTQTQLAFKLLLPATSYEQFSMYSLQYVPIKFNQTLVRTVNGHPAVVLSTESKISFIPNNALCMGHNPIVCYPAVQYSKNLCEADIILYQRISRCNVTIAKLPNSVSQVFRSNFNPFEITVVPFEEESVIKRCPGHSPSQYKISLISQYRLDKDCSLAGNGWYIRGIRRGNSLVKLNNNLPLELPAINMSWDKIIYPSVVQELATHNKLTLPIASLMIKPVHPIAPTISPTNNRFPILTIVLGGTISVCTILYAVCYHIYAKRNFMAASLSRALMGYIPEALKPLLKGGKTTATQTDA